jgi:hypothetical protein
LGPPRGCAIHKDFARSRTALNRVRFKALSVRDVPHVHTFKWSDTRSVQQIDIYRDGSFVVEIGARDCRAVNLTSQQFPQQR